MRQCEHSSLTLCWEFLEQGEGEEIISLLDEVKREGKEEKVHTSEVWSSRLFSGRNGMTNGVKSEDEMAQAGGEVALSQILLFVPQKQGFYEPSADALR